LSFDDISPSYLTSEKLTEVIRFVNELGIPCTLFVVPDSKPCQGSSDFTLELTRAIDFGHELSLHGYTHNRNEFGISYPPPHFASLPIPFPSLQKQEQLLKEGREKLLKLTGVRIEGFRAPGYLYNSNTLRALANLGFRYDSSATFFKTAHCSRFRVQWLHDSNPFISKGIVEIPVTGDYTYNLDTMKPLSVLRTAIRDFGLARSSEGVFVLNNHPAKFQEREYRFLKTLIRKIHGEVTFRTLVDIAKKIQIVRSIDRARVLGGFQ
jgi:predicted deacetylase